MTTTNAKKSEIQAEINALMGVEHLVATNEGTFSALDAHRACGTGDPRFATRRIYQTVGGKIRQTGPDEDRAPGLMRYIGLEALGNDRRRLADLYEALRAAE